jgi:hypothetical protein
MRFQESIEKLASRANSNAWLVHRGRLLETTVLLGAGDAGCLVRIRSGRVDGIDHGPFVMPRWTFALRGSADAWETFWQPLPPPGCHDLMALIKTRRLVLEGDHYPFFANLRYFKELLALPRARNLEASGAAR